MSGASGRVDEALGIFGRLVVLGGVALVTMVLMGMLLKPVLPLGLPAGEAGRTLFALLLAVSLLVGTTVAAVIFERGDWGLVGFAVRGLHPVGLLASLGVGVIAIAAPALMLLQAGQAEIVIAPSNGAWGTYAAEVGLTLAMVALADELIFRGYLQGLLTDRWGAAVAIGVSSLLFGFAQLRLPGATPAVVAGAVAMGLVLSSVRRTTGSLPASWLAHFAITWSQAAVLHAPLRGMAMGLPPAYRWESTGPAWLSGGAAGVEGSVVTAGWLLVVTFLVLRTVRPISRRPRV